jgi:beta-galactosidase
VRVWPAEGLDADAIDDGWACWTRRPAAPPLPAAQAVPIAAPGEPPAITWGPHVPWREGPVPCAPDDAAFERAAGRWRLELPPGVQPAQGRLLAAVRYVGDVARLYADGRLVDDHFYDGDTWWIGLDRHADGARWPTFELRILPLAEEAPIFLEEAAWSLRREAGRGAAVLEVPLALWVRDRLELG